MALVHPHCTERVINQAVSSPPLLQEASCSQIQICDGFSPREIHVGCQCGALVLAKAATASRAVGTYSTSDCSSASIGKKEDRAEGRASPP